MLYYFLYLIRTLVGDRLSFFSFFLPRAITTERRNDKAKQWVSQVKKKKKEFPYNKDENKPINQEISARRKGRSIAGQI
jgi:hypothetical protein